MTITNVPGVQVGHWTDGAALTGVTVVTFPEPNSAAVEIRGAAPGTREVALLQPDDPGHNTLWGECLRPGRGGWGDG